VRALKLFTLQLKRGKGPQRKPQKTAGTVVKGTHSRQTKVRGERTGRTGGTGKHTGARKGGTGEGKYSQDRRGGNGEGADPKRIRPVRPPGEVDEPPENFVQKIKHSAAREQGEGGLKNGE